MILSTRELDVVEQLTRVRVSIHATPAGTFDASPSPGSVLSLYETQNALLVFYLSIST